MRHLILLICLLSFLNISWSQNRSIEFETGKFSEILAKAKAENKLVFIDAYTTWCGPCKWMSHNIFTNDTIADYFNSNFVNAKIDMEKGEGIDIAKKYDVRCYPNLLFVDGDGNIVHRAAGASPEIQSYIEMGDKAMSSDDNYAAVMKRYEEQKNKNPKQIAEVIDMMANTCLSFTSYIDDYYSTVKPEEYTNSTSWKILYYYVGDMDHLAFKHLMEHQDDYSAIYTKDSVMDKIESVYQRKASKLLYAREFDEKAYKAYVNEVSKLNFASKDKMVFTMNLNLYEKEGNWKKVGELAFSENGHSYLDAGSFNSICWAMFEKVDDQSLLKAAADAMKVVTATEEGKIWAYIDTYASLLYKTKNKAEAEKAAKWAIESAKEEGAAPEEYQATEELLEKIMKL